MFSGILEEDSVGLPEPVAASPNKRKRTAGRDIDPAAGIVTAVDENHFGARSHGL